MASPTSLDDYVSAGYYLVQPSAAALLSLSSCLCASFPNAWTIDWVKGENPHEHAAALNIDRGRLPEIIAWATNAFGEEFGWPNVFYTLKAAREARARFFNAESKIEVVGLGLHRSDAPGFVGFAKPVPSLPGYAPRGETGIYECVRDSRPMESGATFLGFEPLSVWVGLFACSWICLGMEREFAPNEHGFLGSIDDARRCAEGAKSSGLWLPWLIARYEAVC